MNLKTAIVAAATLLVLPGLSLGQTTTITIPSGTKVYGELDEQVTSNQRQTRVGDYVRTRVWRNVVVDGETVIEAGAPMTVRVADVQRRRMAGRAGHVELQAVSVRTTDGTEVYLDGGYDQRGQRRIALAASLAAFVAWPTIFIRGREAELPPGMVFDAMVPADTRINVARSSRPTLRLNLASRLSAEVLYDEIEERQTELPLQITMCEVPWSSSLSVTSINEKSIDPLLIAVGDTTTSDECTSARSTVSLRALAAHFDRGINRFTVSGGGETVEIVLDIEM